MSIEMIFFSSGIFSARAKIHWIYKEIQAYDLANRATLRDVWPKRGMKLGTVF